MSSNTKSTKSSQSGSGKRLAITSGDNGQPSVISGLGTPVMGNQADPSRATVTPKVIIEKIFSNRKRIEFLIFKPTPLGNITKVYYVTIIDIILYSFKIYLKLFYAIA